MYHSPLLSLGGINPTTMAIAKAIRVAASTLHHNKSYLGDRYRRLRTKLGAPKAITTMAHKTGQNYLAYAHSSRPF
jgi:hypothetical protein